jgi:hypothetical protein
MSKVKFYVGDQEVLMPEKGRGESLFGAIPAHLARETTPREIKPSPIHDAIAAVIDHEELGGIAHVDDIQAGLFHLHGLSYKSAPLYSHLANAVKLGRIFKVEAKRGFYSTVPVAAVPHESAEAEDDVETEASANFNEDAGFDAPAPVSAAPVSRPVHGSPSRPGLQRSPLAVGRGVR